MDYVTLIGLAQLLAAVVILPVYRVLWRMRTNELRHLSDDIAQIRLDVAGLRRDFHRHLEQHLHDHAR